MRDRIVEMENSLHLLDKRICYELMEIEVLQGNSKISIEADEYFKITEWAMNLVFDQIQTLGDEAGDMEDFYL
ncbi:MAG: hypothetical protein HQM12_20115 [SAR324 cluster bacterium]|nr:hypothetical protein [SAR324 cluster bacterium]